MLVDKCRGVGHAVTKSLCKRERKRNEVESMRMRAYRTGERHRGGVREHLKTARPMARNTMPTMMGILRDRGFLTSTRDGQTDMHLPAVSREWVSRHSLDDVLSRFLGDRRARSSANCWKRGSLTPKRSKAF
jgi:predicted transcriptional regulator